MSCFLKAFTLAIDKAVGEGEQGLFPVNAESEEDTAALQHWCGRQPGRPSQQDTARVRGVWSSLDNCVNSLLEVNTKFHNTLGNVISLSVSGCGCELVNPSGLFLPPSGRCS